VPGVWLPPKVSHRLEQERMAEYARLAVLTSHHAQMADFNRDLKQIDPYLELVKCKEHIEPGSPLKPGYWHIIRHNPGAPPSIMVIEGPDGEFVEPTSQIFEMLKRSDLQNPAVEYRRKQREREMDLARERREAREREERNDEVRERYLAGTRAQVSMTDVPWHQNAAGKRGRRQR
jgi:hypothetical protein